jgi:hypothetical protein
VIWDNYYPYFFTTPIPLPSGRVILPLIIFIPSKISVEIA